MRAAATPKSRHCLAAQIFSVSGKHQSNRHSDAFPLSGIPIGVVTDSSPGLISILRSALDRLGDESTGGSSDPAVVAFKRRILRSIAQLELTRNSLKAPDVVIPQALPPASTPPTSPSLAEEPATPPASDVQPQLAPDSVIVLVARRSRKSGSDDSSGGHSSAA